VTNEAFAALVHRLEAVAAARPAAYRRRVVLFALLGYGYVLGVLAAALGALALAIAGVVLGEVRAGSGLVKGTEALATLAAVLLRGLWVRLDPPEGIPLRAADAPELFATIERVRRHLRAPRVHQVLLVDAFNAAVCQVPRLGVLGWQKNHLLIGLPFLQAFSREQLEAVLAHEFGHLSGAHGRLGGWIYRVRATWTRITEKMEAKGHWASFVFLPFFRWYAPWFAAWSFVQARRQEIEADRASAELVGASTAADALCGSAIAGAFLEESWWPRVYAAADRAPRPDAAAPYTTLRQALRAGPRREDAQAWLSAALRRTTGTTDTHPCLYDRLAALGAEARVPAPPETSAGEALLGRALPALARALDERWRREVEAWWSERHGRVASATARLAALDAEAAAAPLAPAQAFEQARLREQLEGAEPAQPLYAALVLREPGHVGARFALGRILLARDDESGLAHLEEAAKRSDEAILPACELAWRYLKRHGSDAEAERWRERAVARQAVVDGAAAERATFRLDGRYLPHGVEPRELAALREALAAHPSVRRAWLVRRDVDFEPERPLFALGVVQKRALFGQRNKDLALQQELVDTVPLPGEAFVLVLNHRRAKQRRVFTAVPGSRIL
jgi:Zn-dependent protease with chaperone function